MLFFKYKRHYVSYRVCYIILCVKSFEVWHAGKKENMATSLGQDRKANCTSDVDLLLHPELLSQEFLKQILSEVSQHFLVYFKVYATCAVCGFSVQPLAYSLLAC